MQDMPRQEDFDRESLSAEEREVGQRLADLINIAASAKIQMMDSEAGAKFAEADKAVFDYFSAVPDDVKRGAWLYSEWLRNHGEYFVHDAPERMQ